MVVKRVGILYHPKKEAASSLGKDLEGVIGSYGASAWVCSAWEKEQLKTLIPDTDVVVSIGGDGTMLRAAQAVVPGVVPIIGINLGRLGFMTELCADEVTDKLPALLNGEGWIDERAILEVQLLDTEQIFYALNDVVLARGAIARTVYIEADIDNERLTTYTADGVIVATATGSTGYSLAAGGPILHPQAREFILLPIVPHLSSTYTLVLPSTAVVNLRITTAAEATLSVDGHTNLSLFGGARVIVRLSPHKVRFLRIHPEAFYASLEQKLRGKR